MVEVPPPKTSRSRNKPCVHFVEQVYEANPLLCFQSGGPMWILAFTEQPEATERCSDPLGALPHPLRQPAGIHRCVIP